MQRSISIHISCLSSNSFQILRIWLWIHSNFQYRTRSGSVSLLSSAYTCVVRNLRLRVQRFAVLSLLSSRYFIRRRICRCCYHECAIGFPPCFVQSCHILLLSHSHWLCLLSQRRICTEPHNIGFRHFTRVSSCTIFSP